jgi:hypothetical protein
MLFCTEKKNNFNGSLHFKCNKSSTRDYFALRAKHRKSKRSKKSIHPEIFSLHLHFIMFPPIFLFLHNLLASAHLEFIFFSIFYVRQHFSLIFCFFSCIGVHFIFFLFHSVNSTICAKKSEIHKRCTCVDIKGK